MTNLRHWSTRLLHHVVRFHIKVSEKHASSTFRVETRSVIKFMGVKGYVENRATKLFLPINITLKTEAVHFSETLVYNQATKTTSRIYTRIATKPSNHKIPVIQQISCQAI
jgi:hypothetical protein